MPALICDALRCVRPGSVPWLWHRREFALLYVGWVRLVFWLASDLLAVMLPRQSENSITF